MQNDDLPTVPQIVLLSSVDVPSDCTLFGIWVGDRCIGYIVIGPDGRELVTADLAEALAFAEDVTRTRRPGR
jgi:hypothetical protein